MSQVRARSSHNLRSHITGLSQKRVCPARGSPISSSFADWHEDKWSACSPSFLAEFRSHGTYSGIAWQLWNCTFSYFTAGDVWNAASVSFGHDVQSSVFVIRGTFTIPQSPQEILSGRKKEAWNTSVPITTVTVMVGL